MASVPFDQLDGVIWMNGKMVDWPDAKLHVLSHGLHYGSSVFEGELMYGGEIFKLTEHTERLFASAEVLGFKIPYTVEEIDQACRDVCAKCGLTEAYVRPVAWRGSEISTPAATPLARPWSWRGSPGPWSAFWSRASDSGVATTCCQIS